jgi:hypothetical protein
MKKKAGKAGKVRMIEKILPAGDRDRAKMMSRIPLGREAVREKTIIVINRVRAGNKEDLHPPV